MNYGFITKSPIEIYRVTHHIPYVTRGQYYKRPGRPSVSKMDQDAIGPVPGVPAYTLKVSTSHPGASHIDTSPFLENHGV